MLFAVRDNHNQCIFDLGVGIGIPMLHVILRTSRITFTFLNSLQNMSFKTTALMYMRTLGASPTSPSSLSPFRSFIAFPFLIGLVSVIYGARTVRTLRKHRRQLEHPELCVSDLKLVNFNHRQWPTTNAIHTNHSNYDVATPRH